MDDPYVRAVRVTRIVDGDTIDVEVDLGFRVSTKVRVRLSGVDTPEVRGPERPEGLKSSDFVRRWVGESTEWSTEDFPLRMRSTKTGKFGRWLADIWSPRDPGVTLNQVLLDTGHADPY
jgi:micrococcal nuclease